MFELHGMDIIRASYHMADKAVRRMAIFADDNILLVRGAGVHGTLADRETWVVLRVFSVTDSKL